MKNVIVLANGAKAHVRRAVDEALPWLREQAHLVVVDLEEKVDIEHVAADMVIIFGGDGAILSAARRLGRNQVPAVGVNLGKFGFLAEVSLSELRSGLGRILAGEFQAASRMMLQCRVKRGERLIKDSLALNDAVISRSSLSRLIAIQLSIDSEEVTKYYCDGLIVSTPVGSTAHSLAAGGPILTHDMEAFIVTPICPHTLTNRPLVVSAQRRIEMGVLPEAKSVALTVDGQVYVELLPGDRVQVERSELRFQLIQTQERTFFQTLREKLQWGGHPKYAGR
ncbi:MAG: NAD(+)/NADH kinase [Planctomycetes bacterium]|nr:NAD(+)/NADH kinase [Planctomycetota bacterium]MBM4081520.1 NAD(+)/NADH kinase [Planctomycetota bacterium]